MGASRMTDTEAEVWRTVEAMNLAWTSGRVDDLAAFFHPEIAAVTPTDRDRLDGRDACVAAWRRFTEAATIRAWRAKEPRVRVFGDAAVVAYGYELECEIGGRPAELAGRDLFFMVRLGGRWLAVADAFSPYPAPARDGARGEIEEVARLWLSLWQGGDLADFDRIHARGFVDHSPSGRDTGREGFRRGIADLYRAFPDFFGREEDMLVDAGSGRAAIRWSATGTHEGSFLGREPTGRRVRFAGIEVIRVEGGQVAERWGEWDGLDVADQIDQAGCEAVADQARHVLTILAVSDLERSRRFYREAFGWPERVHVPVYVEFALPGGRGLGLYVREGFARNVGQAPEPCLPGAITATEIYLHCSDLDVAASRLEGAGACQLSPRAPRDWGDEAAYFADPDGNVLVVARPMAAGGGQDRGIPAPLVATARGSSQSPVEGSRVSRLIDISPALGSGLAVWPGDAPFSRTVRRTIEGGSGFELSCITSTVHAGAHADAPSHFAAGGATVDELPLDAYFGPCRVIRVDVERGARVQPGDLRSPVDAPRILLRTGTFGMRERFASDFAGVAPELISFLASRGVRLVGIDTPSVDLFDDADLASHRAAGRSGIAILEGLVLDHVEPGRYMLVALPLKIEGGDGSPVRAALVEEER